MLFADCTCTELAAVLLLRVTVKDINFVPLLPSLTLASLIENWLETTACVVKLMSSNSKYCMPPGIVTITDVTNCPAKAPDMVMPFTTPLPPPTGMEAVPVAEPPAARFPVNVMVPDVGLFPKRSEAA